MDTNNNLDLEAIKARAEAASPPPWRTGEQSHWEAANCVYMEPKRAFEGGRRICRCYISNPRPASDDIDLQDWANAAFIAQARQDVPDLVGKIERLQAAFATFFEEILRLVFGNLNQSQAERLSLADAIDRLEEAVREKYDLGPGVILGLVASEALKDLEATRRDE